MAAFITAFDTLDTELDDDFERVDEEPEELKIDVQPNRPGMPFPTTPHPYPPPPSVPSRTITNQSDDR